MKLYDELVGRAGAADASMGRLAEKEMAAETKRRAIRQLDDMLTEMAADGWLDPGEVASLRAEAERLGVDLGLPNASGSLKADASLLDEAHMRLGRAVDANTDRGFEFEVQRHLAEYHQSFDAASKVSKAEHEIYMAAIKNLVA